MPLYSLQQLLGVDAIIGYSDYTDYRILPGIQVVDLGD